MNADDDTRLASTSGLSGAAATTSKAPNKALTPSPSNTGANSTPTEARYLLGLEPSNPILLDTAEAGVVSQEKIVEPAISQPLNSHASDELEPEDEEMKHIEELLRPTTPGSDIIPDVSPPSVPVAISKPPSPPPPSSPLTNLPQDIAAILGLVDLTATASPNPPQTSDTFKTEIVPTSIYVEDPGSSTSAPAAEVAPPTTKADDSDSDDSSSDWDSSSDSDAPPAKRFIPSKGKGKAAASDDDDSDDEGGGGGKQAKVAPKTTNEILVPDVQPPSIERVGEDERIEHIGEIMSVIDSVVVVKGTPGSAGEKVLDTGSLLAWDDRVVVGEVFETFGPTHLPMYSIRFPSSSPTHIPPDVFRKGRKVFHAPDRSHYVFTRAIQHIKGTDASNLHDEEVGSDQEEFSDDEKEREWKARRKNARGGSAGRHPYADRPKPTDDGDYPFDSSYYDEEPASSSTAPPRRDMRAPPAPYDDGGMVPYDEPDDDAMSVASALPAPPSPSYDRPRDRGRGASRGRGRGGRDRGGGRGRGRGFQRGRGGPSHHGGRGGYPQSPQQDFTFTPPVMDNTPYSPHQHMPFMPQQGQFPQQQPQQPFFGGMPMGHINPNFFAAAMMGGMNMGQMGGWNYPMGMMGGGQGMMPQDQYDPQQPGGGWQGGDGQGQDHQGYPPGPSNG